MKKIIFTLIALTLILPFACNPKEEIAPENPCDGQEEVKADFSICEENGLMPIDWKYYDTDTLWNNGARFTANIKDVEYTWKIGNETIKEKSFLRTNFPLDKWITISLTVKKKPNKLCFPFDDGIDSLTRKFMIVDGAKRKPLVYGKWLGYNTSNPKDTFTIEFNAGIIPDYGNQFYVKNLNRNCNSIPLFEGYPVVYFENYAQAFRQIYFGHNIFAAYGCLRPMGFALVNNKNHDSITINYSEQIRPVNVGESVSGIERINKTFTGTRVK
jgi:hypothetical protein